MLTERQRLILQVVVDDYVKSAEPVGSRSISKRPEITFSPATIRNEMADLEEMGYLTQPHTSAGRIPTNKGYRFFVDFLMEPKLSLASVQQIQMLFAQQFVEFEQVIKETASILSDLTQYTSIVLGPEVFDTKLKHIQFVPLTKQTAVAIIVTNTGYVEHRKIAIPEGIAISQIEQLINLLNFKLADVPLYQLRERVNTEIASELHKHVEQYRQSMQILEQTFLPTQEEKIFLGGTTNIFSQPEFRDLEKVRDLFELLEQRDRIHDLFSGISDPDDVRIQIGSENEHKAISNCSVITTAYTINGKPVGTLSILGPTRMDYRKVYSIMQYLTRDLSSLLSRLYEQDR